MNVPPFIETYGAVVVRVHLGKENVQFAIRHCQPCATEGALQLFLGDVPVVVAVYALEECKQLPLCLVDEVTEFFTTRVSIASNKAPLPGA